VAAAQRTPGRGNANKSDGLAALAFLGFVAPIIDILVGATGSISNAPIKLQGYKVSTCLLRFHQTAGLQGEAVDRNFGWSEQSSRGHRI
jgi:hypothetical protein